VPRIFALIQGAIDEQADILDVPGGVPRAVYVDYSFMTAAPAARGAVGSSAALDCSRAM
jgi:hypothetical protein